MTYIYIYIYGFSVLLALLFSLCEFVEKVAKKMRNVFQHFKTFFFTHTQ